MTALGNPNTGQITHIRATDWHCMFPKSKDVEGFDPVQIENTMIQLSVNQVPEACCAATTWDEATGLDSLAFRAGLLNPRGKRLRQVKPAQAYMQSSKWRPEGDALNEY